MEKVRLKGGSLSGTYLFKPESGRPFVRKDVSLVENREYGFQRWYSQLKRLQRYSVLAPKAFPALLDYGMQGDRAFFDLEYVEGSVTAHEYLCQTSDKKEAEKILLRILEVTAALHEIQFRSSPRSVELYFREEVERRLADCKESQRFLEFRKNEHVFFNGVEVPSILLQLGDLRAALLKSYQYPYEALTHGNLTLENILYQPSTDRIVFIDPYEENIIDSVIAELSQLLQSSNSKYELYNEAKVTVEASGVSATIPTRPGLEYFNTFLMEKIKERYKASDQLAIRLFEVTQFIRMLPFKMVLSEDKMIFFYCLASWLFQEIRKEYGI